MKKMSRQNPRLSAILLATCLPSGLAMAQFGGFQRTDYPSPQNQPDHMALGDTDGDADLDVVVSGSSGLHVVSNNGDGTLGPVNFSTLSAPSGFVVLDDFDGLNGLDICIIRRANPGSVTVLLNDGAGGFSFLPVVVVGQAPPRGVPADLDGDGDKDLAVISEFGEFTVLLNDGSGTLVPQPPVAIGSLSPKALAALDLNQDGALDLVVHEITNNRLRVYLNDGVGAFASANLSYTTPSGSRWSLTTADMNNDGREDALFSAGSVVTFLNNGNGTLSPQTAFSGLGQWPDSVYPPDLDGDGVRDVLSGDTNSSQIHYAFGNGDGTFNTASANATSNSVSWVASGDMDGNGSADVVAHTRNPGTIAIFINQTDVVPPGTFSLLAPTDGATNLALPEHVASWGSPVPTFQWSKPSGFTVTYDLSISTTGANPVEVYSAAGLTDTRHPAPTGVLAPGIEYEWEVTAFNSVGSTPTTSHTFTTAPGPNPCVPDLTGDGVLDFFDVQAFLQAFYVGCP